MREYKGVQFDVKEIELGRWLWVYRHEGREIVSKELYRSYDAASEACVEAINNLLYR